MYRPHAFVTLARGLQRVQSRSDMERGRGDDAPPRRRAPRRAERWRAINGEQRNKAHPTPLASTRHCVLVASAPRAFSLKKGWGAVAERMGVRALLLCLRPPTTAGPRYSSIYINRQVLASSERGEVCDCAAAPVRDVVLAFSLQAPRSTVPHLISRANS